MYLTKYERETIVNFNEGEDTASVYTHNKPLRRRLEQLAQERPEECRLYRVSHWDQAVEYYIPKSWIKIRPPRQISDAEKERMRENFKKAVLARNSPIIIGDRDHADARPGKDTSQPSDVEKEA